MSKYCGDEDSAVVVCTVFSSDEMMGSEFVFVGLLRRVGSSALDLSLIFACLADVPMANFSLFAPASWAVFTGGHAARCPSRSASVYP